MADDDPDLECDLAVIGGGAAGCALAWEAASRGLSAVLMERSDFGAGASANSLRIVHGGLRYLQTLDIGRARKSAAERSAMLRIAPHLVAPVRCMLPTQPGLTRGRLALALGLTANAALTFDRNRGLPADRRLAAGGIVTIDRYREAAPGIVAERLTGAAFWYDALIGDPERLCLSFAISAQHLGATLLNHVEAIEIQPRATDGRSTISARDRIDGRAITCRAAAVADCRGDWHASLVAGTAAAGAPSPVVTAANLVLRAPAPAHVVGFPDRDTSGRIVPGRSYFAAPQDGAVAVGTWYFAEPPGTTAASIDEKRLDDMIAAVNRATTWRVDRDAVLDIQAGLLPRDPESPEHTPTPADRPRIGIDPHDATGRVWRVQTEKWTTVRQVAERSLDAIAAATSLRTAPSQTATRPLHDASVNDRDLASDAALDRGTAIVDDAVHERLRTRFGGSAQEILDRMASDPAACRPLAGSDAVTLAEVGYCIREELPRTLEDLVFRRLGFPVWAPPSESALTEAAQMMADRLGWSSDDVTDSIVRCRKASASSMIYSAPLADSTDRQGAAQ